jgi:hypothetical protein
MDEIERSAYAGEVAAASKTVRDAIALEVFEAMQPYKDDNEIAEPMSNYLVQASKAAISGRGRKQPYASRYLALHVAMQTALSFETGPTDLDSQTPCCANASNTSSSPTMRAV